MGETSNAVSVCNLLSSRPKREAWIPSWEWELRKLGHCRQLPPRKNKLSKGVRCQSIYVQVKKTCGFSLPFVILLRVKGVILMMVRFLDPMIS